MGNRAVVQFVDDHDSIGHAVYQQWGADDVPQWLREAAPVMRRGSASYATARWAAFLCDKYPGGLSVGIERGELAFDPENGLYVVNCSTGKVTLFREGRDGSLARCGRPFTIPLGKF